MHNKEHTRWRNPGNKGTDALLTPPNLLNALGKFDLDPCCPNKMPWKTAAKMIKEPVNGLAVPWNGRVWCNPPYSNPLPWVNRMAEHGNGVMLLSAKSSDTKWGQRALVTCDAVLFLSGRLLFWTPEGIETKGKWLPNMLCAYGDKNIVVLESLVGYSGILFKKGIKT